MVDDSQSEMMAVRWKIFELRVQIAETSQRAIPPCLRGVDKTWAYGLPPEKRKIYINIRNIKMKIRNEISKRKNLSKELE